MGKLDPVMLSVLCVQGFGTSQTFNTEDTEEHRVGLLFPVFAVDHALDSVPQMCHVEIDQQADSDSAQPHV